MSTYKYLDISISPCDHITSVWFVAKDEDSVTSC